MESGINYTKWRGADIVIRQDSDGIGSFEVASLLEGNADAFGGYWKHETPFDDTIFTLSRKAGESFDNTNFDETSYNRGWIILQYVA